MNSLNKVQLIGNITSDPEIKQTPNGQTVATFSIATNRDWKDAQGEKQSVAEFHNIVAWSKLAEIIEQYVKKWQKTYIEWRLQTRSWEDQDGNKKYKTEIIAENLIMLGSKKEWSEENRFDEDPLKKETKKKQPVKEEEIDISDIPF